MKLYILLTFVLSFFTVGCKKEAKGCMGVKPVDEAPQMTAYSAANNMTVSKHSSGIYYCITDSGHGMRPLATSNVSVTYTGKLLNGTIFDSSPNTISFSLNNVIEGWQLGLPLIKKGGKIKLIIPSALAYGCNGNNGIPPNAPLFFDVHLIEVN